MTVKVIETYHIRDRGMSILVTEAGDYACDYTVVQSVQTEDGGFEFLDKGSCKTSDPERAGVLFTMYVKCSGCCEFNMDCLHLCNTKMIDDVYEVIKFCRQEAERWISHWTGD